jgi:hypothetical protein
MKIRILLTLILLLGFYTAEAQIDRAKIAKEADRFFQAENYSAAQPLYNQLLTLSLKDHDLNYKFGTCLLYTSHSKSSGLTRLEYAVESPSISNEAWYYLGHANHLNYKFSVAIDCFDRYIAEASKDDPFIKRAITSIEQCKNAQKLLKNITKLQIIAKRKMKTDHFFRLYNMDNIGGVIIPVTDELLSKLDKKNNHFPIVHIPPWPKKSIYFSSYGQKGTNGLDLYKIDRLENGDFSEPQILPMTLNTSLDERYPFLSPNGKWLYFSSQGHNSMGGYDVFRCSYNVKTDEYGPPTNMDFPINSPGNDILYVHDSLYHRQYFTTDRASKFGEVYVYESSLEKRPENQSVIIGNFSNKVNSTNNEIKITVFRTSTKKALKVVYSQSNGEFQIPVQPNDTLTYQVEVLGEHKIFSGQTISPSTKENLHLFKQDLSLELINGVERLVIKNLFSFEYSNLEKESIRSSYYTSLARPNTSQEDSSQMESSEVFMEPDLTADTCIKVYKHFFKYNKNRIDDLNNPKLASFVECFRASVERKGKIKIYIESSASKVPTKTYKSNIELAEVRKNLAVKMVIKFLRTLNTSPDAYEIIVSHKVQGPEYQNDFIKNKAAYEKWQYVIIQLE